MERGNDWEKRLLSPVTFLMKICMVEMASGDAERESGVEECILSVACDLQRPRISKVSFLMKGMLSL